MEITHTSRIPAISIVLISACALAYEVLLMRIFSIVQWHHFAYMIISLALLGYGVSGTFLSIVQKHLYKRYFISYYSNGLLFGLSILISFLAAQAVSFNPEELIWDWRGYSKLLLIYVCLAVPFFFGANCVALSFVHFRENISKVYAFDLVGAGLGSIGIILVLFSAMPNDAVRYLSLTGVSAALVAWVEVRHKNKILLLGGVIAMILIIFFPQKWLQMSISPYKSLPQILNISGTHVVDQRSSPLGLISVVASDKVPFRYAPGLSLLAKQTPPQQMAVFTDADAMTVINKNSGDRQQFAYMDYFTSAVPYHLKPVDYVLVLGAGAGSEVLQAQYFNAGHITAVELNPQIVHLMTGTYASYSGNLYTSDNVTVKVAEARGFLLQDKNRYDVIQLALLDSFSAASTGLYALNESYLYTVEAMVDMLQRLQPQGYLTVTRWVKVPPKDTVKLFATAIQALKAIQIKDPENHLVLIRGWQTSTLLVKKTFITPDEIENIKRFNEARAFDAAYYPGMLQTQANRYNILSEPYFYLAAKSLLSADSERFIKHYKFNIRPATDNKPYFFNFFKWGTFDELWSLRRQGAMGMVEWGYMLLVVTLIQALIVSILLILAPLTMLKKIVDASSARLLKLKVLFYFAAIGLAYLFLEIVFVQKFMLFLHHPLYSATAILTGLLLFSGLGSAFSSRMIARFGGRRTVVYAVTGISVLSLLYNLLLPFIFAHTMSLPVVLKMVLSVMLICPIAILMGMPFPAALSELGESNRGLIPWAWAINGCASVISAVLAALIAVDYGFTVVILVVVLLYIIATLTFPRVAVPG